MVALVALSCLRKIFSFTLGNKFKFKIVFFELFALKIIVFM